MNRIETLSEFALINQLTRGLSRHPDQVNHRHEADAEILRQPDGSFLAATVDTLFEEYHLGLIRDPFSVGWSVVAHSLSDLAAVAAQPIGVLLALTLPRKQEQGWSDEFFAGVQAALTQHGTHCLGGDTSFADPASFTCTALGRITHPKPLSRVGAESGDLLYVTGPLGAGNLLAIARQADLETWKTLEKDYRPRARLREIQHLRPFVKCAIDTSDALLQALAIIAAVNGVGIEFAHREELYNPMMARMASRIRFPLWLVNVFGLGEYELLLAVDPVQEAAFVAEAGRHHIAAAKVGCVTQEPGIRMLDNGNRYDLDAPYLLNLYGTCDSIEVYLRELVAYDVKMRAAVMA